MNFLTPTHDRCPLLPLLFVWVILSFPRAFQELKLVLLFFVILDFFLLAFVRRELAFSQKILFIYSFPISVGLVGALFGIYNGNSSQAVLDGLKLYLLWSVLVVLLLNYLIKFNALLIIHYSVILSAITNAAINIPLVFYAYGGTNFFPLWFEERMSLGVGFHEGYVHIVSHNIGMLLFIVPYLIATVWRTDGRQEMRWVVWVALAACLLLAALSGRRALWLVVLAVPYLLWILTLISGTKERVKSYTFLIVAIYGIPLAAIMLMFITISDHSILTRLITAFSSEDERSTQSVHLIDSFLRNPFFGSGFGGVSSYVREPESPWAYELSYHVILFNFGFFGAGLLIFALFYALFNAVRMIRRGIFKDQNGVFPIVLGSAGLLIANYSNPYFGTFDYLFVLGFLFMLGSLPRDKAGIAPRRSKRVWIS